MIFKYFLVRIRRVWLKNRLHDLIRGFDYLLTPSCVILDKLQRKQYFSLVEKKQHDLSYKDMKIRHEKKSIN